MNCLYHITERKNLLSIMTFGIKTNIGHTCLLVGAGGIPPTSWVEKYGKQPVFLAEDTNLVFKEMASKEYCKEKDMVILKISPKNLELRSHDYRGYKETVSLSDIPRENILKVEEIQ